MWSNGQRYTQVPEFVKVVEAGGCLGG